MWRSERLCTVGRGRACGLQACSPIPHFLPRVCTHHHLSHPFSAHPLPLLCVHYLTRYFDLQTVEDSSKGGCRNGYFRHADSSILDYNGAHTSGSPGDQGLEEGELVSLLTPLFGEKAVWFLESRWTWGPGGVPSAVGGEESSLC